jgi:hypothetical protein
VDALTLHVAHVRFAAALGGAREPAAVEWGATQALTLRSGATLPLTAGIARMAPGSYAGAEVALQSGFRLQAFCRTASAFVYTTAAGVATLPATPAVMPADYAALQYDYTASVPLSVGTTEDAAAAAIASQTFIRAVYNYDVDAGSTVHLLLDAAFAVACYDGSAAAGAQLLPPLGHDDAAAFDWSRPAFAFSAAALPVFIQASSGRDGAAAVVGETYAFAANASALPQPGAPADWTRLALATLTWAGAGADASLLDMRGTGGGGGSDGALDVSGGFSAFRRASDAAWSFCSGQPRLGEYSYACERELAGFTRTADFSTVRSFAVADGPDCGTAAAAPCLGAPATVFYVQLPRGA